MGGGTIAVLRGARASLFARTLPHQAAVRRSSTSALAYKAIRQRRGPLPITEVPPAWSAESAVSNILYETPTPSEAPTKKHVLNCLVQDEPGVLSGVSGILAGRGFNILSLCVCHTEVKDLSRLTLVLAGQDGVVEQARRQLEDLVPVWAILNYTGTAIVQRELLLAKINILGPEFYEELLQHHREINAQVEHVVSTEEAQAAPVSTDQTLELKKQATNEVATEFHPNNMPASKALRHKHEHLQSITYLVHQFGGSVVDISTASCTIELSAKPERVDSFVKLMAPFGILESARTGLMVMPRSQLSHDEEDIPVNEADDPVDVSQLPPG